MATETSPPIPFSGARRFFSTSYESAFSGETYTSRVRRSPSGAGRLTSRSSAHRNAASVFPDPVGAETSTFSPAAIAGQALACAAVGRSNERVNQSRTRGSNDASGSEGMRPTSLLASGRRPRAPDLPAWVGCSPSGYGGSVPISRRFPALAAAAALCLPIAACGDSDVDKAKNEVQDAADQVKGDLDDVSKKDLENARDDAEDAAKNGS